MAARIVRRSTRDNQSVVIIGAGDQEYRLAIKPAVDFNRTVIGYVAWLQHNGWIYTSEDEAIAAVCSWVDVMEGFVPQHAVIDVTDDGDSAPARSIFAVE